MWNWSIDALLVLSLLSGLQSFLHQEVLHAVCEQTPGPVPTTDSGRTGQEEAERQGCCVMMSDKRSITCSPIGEKCLTGHVKRPMCQAAASALFDQIYTGPNFTKSKHPVIYKHSSWCLLFGWEINTTRQKNTSLCLWPIKVSCCISPQGVICLFVSREFYRSK